MEYICFEVFLFLESKWRGLAFSYKMYMAQGNWLKALDCLQVHIILGGLHVFYDVST